MTKRKLEELNLLDNFLFGSMVTHPELGESFVRELLQIIFNRQFGKLIVVPQKVYYGTDTDIHGARLDVYLEEPLSDTNIENSIVYDLEPDKNSDIKAVEALPRRVRFYHAKIDGDSLQSGKDYENLKNVTVVFISPEQDRGRFSVLFPEPDLRRGKDAATADSPVGREQAFGRTDTSTHHAERTDRHGSGTVPEGI